MIGEIFDRVYPEAALGGEPPVYRPFALIAFGTTVVGGTPLGIWLLAGLHFGAPAVPPSWMLLHASRQIFGFFGTLIVGVAPHLLARFTGRPVVPPPLTRWLAADLGIAVLARLVGTWAEAGGVVLAGALLQALSFFVFASWVWRSLDPPPLGLLRRQLTLSSAWLGVACLLEVMLRARAALGGILLPDLGAMRSVHSLALLGGILGWVLGVLLRAGPMFVADWRSNPCRGQFAVAERHLHQGLSLAQEYGRRPMIARCHLDLAELCRKTGQREASPGAPLPGQGDVR